MKTIPLTQGKVAIVDDEDFEETNKHKWYANKNRYVFYAVRHVGSSEKYNRSNNKRPLIKMHRTILGLTDSKTLADHINGNGLDNRKENLRICTDKQNRHNSKKRKNNTSGFKGVSFHKRVQKWGAKVLDNGKQKHLGYFSCPEHAALAYNIAALNLHGEFARINEIL